MVAEMAQLPVESLTEVHKPFTHEKENGKLDQGPGHNESIKFGSHGGEPIKGEETNVAKANLPKDAAEEWPAPPQIHSFYFVRFRPYNDPKIKAKFDQFDKEIQKRNQTRFELMEELKAKRADRAELTAQLKVLRGEFRQIKSIIDEKKKEMEPLQQALGKLRPNNAYSGGICSSEEELNELIHSLQYRIQHESIPLSEEKQLLREIKQLEGTREKVQANAAMRAKIQESLGQKEDIQDQVKLMGNDLDGVKKENQAVWAKIAQLDTKLKVIDDEIKALQSELAAVTEKRDKTFASLTELRKQQDEANAYFYQYRQLLNKAKNLAVKKNVKALEELSETEVDKFITLWKNNKAFRDDYEKRLLPSLDSRQLSRDGRIRNPDEKPLVVVEAAVTPEPEILPKPIVKQPKGDAKSFSQKDTLPTQKAQKEAGTKVKDTKTVELGDIANAEIPVVSRPSPEVKVDEAKLKEMRREEEIAKAKQALGRKKKLAEKAAAKAAIRAEKEAEKKLKEREKKAKKKAASSGTGEEPAEAVPEVEEPEKTGENNETSVEAPTPAKPKVHKENIIKHRTRSRGPESLQKALLKRKKSNNYWVWAAPAATLVVLLTLVLAYYYLQ